MELDEEKQLQWCSRFAKAFNATNKDRIERIELHDGGGITARLNEEQVCLLVACNGCSLEDINNWLNAIEGALKDDTAQYRKGSRGAIHAVKQIVRAALQRGNRNGANQIEHKIVLLIPVQKLIDPASSMAFFLREVQLSADGLAQIKRAFIVMPPSSVYLLTSEAQERIPLAEVEKESARMSLIEIGREGAQDSQDQSDT